MRLLDTALTLPFGYFQSQPPIGCVTSYPNTPPSRQFNPISKPYSVKQVTLHDGKELSPEWTATSIHLLQGQTPNPSKHG